MRNLTIRDYDLPRLLKWLEEFLGLDLTNMAATHPLRSYIDSYKKWETSKFGKSGIQVTEVPTEIIEFGSFVKAIWLFRDQLTGDIKRDFVCDLVDEQTCYGVFFEITVLIHCWRLEYENLSYRCNKVDSKEPDIMFTNPDLRRIFIECTRKQAKPTRIFDDGNLIEDLKRSLKTKGESYQGLDVPFIYAVHVPEEVALNRNEFRVQLGKEIQEMLKDVIFRNVSWVVFSSYRPPFVKRKDPRGNRVYTTDLMLLRYPNAHVDPSLDVRMYFGPPYPD